jgi:predicted AlkP superfamily pyrophosphatase or phosphodiesterase
MTRVHRCPAVVLLVLLFLFPNADTFAQTPKRSAASPKQSATATATTPKLVLAIVVDQFRYDYLLRFRSDYRGGMARLLNGGAVFADARYIHFPTVTAVGHSTFLTGATPSVSGIINNEWLDRESNKVVTSVSDDATTLLGGAPGAKGSSPHRLLVSTVGDELKMARPTSKVIGISIKDRSAILPSGHTADGAYWFDDKSLHFVTSDYYMKQLPPWVEQVNAAGPATKYANADWMALAAKTGDKPLCTMKKDGNARPCGSIDATPFGNELLESFAEKAIAAEQLGSHPTTDILTLSFSSNDYVGHAVGPDAPEVRDIAIRTDQLIGKLLDFIEARVGRGNTLVVFTADHGVSPTPKANNARRMPGGYLDSVDDAKKIGEALAQKFGPGEWFRASSYGFFYLNRETLAKNKAEAGAVRAFAAEIARGLPHIARVLTYDELLHPGVAPDAVGRAIEVGFYPARGADLELVPEPYFMFSSAPGTTHSTPYSYDNHVPLIFYGTGIRAGTHYEAVTVNDVAPTLAAILGIETPSGSSGRILSEILQ